MTGGYLSGLRCLQLLVLKFWKVALLLIATPVLSDDFGRQEATVEWLNDQLAAASSVARILDARCEERPYIRDGLTVCSYKYSDGAFMDVFADADGILGFDQFMTMAGDDFDRLERESMYIFSLIVWSTMPETVTYQEANEVLLDLYEKSFVSLPAQVEYDDWSFGIGELSICPLATLVFSARRYRSGADAKASIEAFATRECSLLP